MATTTTVATSSVARHDIALSHMVGQRVVVLHRTPVKTVMKQLKYTGPPLLFTMHLCLVASKNMNFDILWLDRHIKDIAKHQKAVEAAVGMGPTPTFVCTGILRKGLGVEAKQK